MYKNFIIPYLYEAQHVSGDTLPIIRSLKLHWQPLVFHMWKVVGRVVGGHCQAHCALLRLVGFFFMNCTMMHGSTNITFINVDLLMLYNIIILQWFGKS